MSVFAPCRTCPVQLVAPVYASAMSPSCSHVEQCLWIMLVVLGGDYDSRSTLDVTKEMPAWFGNIVIPMKLGNLCGAVFPLPHFDVAEEPHGGWVGPTTGGSRTNHWSD